MAVFKSQQIKTIVKRKCLNSMGADKSKIFEPITDKSTERRKQMTEDLLKQQLPEIDKLHKNTKLSFIFSGLSNRFSMQLLSAGTTQFEFAQNGSLVISWNSCNDKQALYKQAQNILNLALCDHNLRSSSSRIGNILFQLSLRMLNGCQEILVGLKPDLIFQGWNKIYASRNDKTKKAFFWWINDRMVYSMLEKYGMKLAAQLISEEIASGNVYGGKNPLQCKHIQILSHLLSAAIVIIEMDLQVQEYQEKASKNK